MEIKSFSRKQAGVIYRAIKNKQIYMSRKGISEMYDMCGEVYVFNTNDAQRVQNQIAAIRNAVDAIFCGAFDMAEISLEHFCKA